MAFSAYLDQKILEKAFLGQDFQVAEHWCSLHTADPGKTGQSEASSAPYARKAVTPFTSVDNDGNGQRDCEESTCADVCAIACGEGIAADALERRGGARRRFLGGGDRPARARAVAISPELEEPLEPFASENGQRGPRLRWERRPAFSSAGTRMVSCTLPFRR